MKIQLKRSNALESGKAKAPTPGQMEYGELAVNYNQGDPSIFLKDANNQIVKIAGEGAIGNSEVPDVDADPHQPDTLDDRYVELSGDNMTGNLTLGTNKVTLNASNGNLTLAGKGTSSSTTAGDSGTTLATKDFIGDGTITIVQPGTTNQTFSVNQSGNKTITLKNDTADVGNGTITIVQSGRSNQTFTVNQSGNTQVNLDNTTYSAGTDLSLSGTTFNVTSATANTASRLVKRDGSGGFSCGTINATGYSMASLTEL